MKINSIIFIALLSIGFISCSEKTKEPINEYIEAAKITLVNEGVDTFEAAMEKWNACVNGAWKTSEIEADRGTYTVAEYQCTHLTHPNRYQEEYKRLYGDKEPALDIEKSFFIKDVRKLIGFVYEKETKILHNTTYRLVTTWQDGKIFNGFVDGFDKAYLDELLTPEKLETLYKFRRAP